MTSSRLAFLAGLGSAALLAGAYFFQYGMGLAPCALCLQQRWPHFAAAALGLIGLVWSQTLVLLLGMIAALTTSGIGLFHTGVERGWWEGPTTCSGNVDFANSTAEQLLERVLAAPVVRCTEVAWEFLGLSMASWNGIASLGLAGVWGLALLRRRAETRG